MRGGKYGALAWLLGNRFKSPERLARLRDRLLQQLIAHAYENVAFYRGLWDAAGVRPCEIRSVEDLSRIPPVEKRELQAAELGARLDRRITDRSRLLELKTSGSSGVPLRFFVDRQDDQFRKAQYLRPYLENGRRPLDTVLRMSDVDPAVGRREAVADRGWFRRLGLLREYRMLPDADRQAQLDAIERLRPDVLVGYGSTLAQLAAESRHRPRLVFTDSELLTSAVRSRIEHGFGCSVLDVYGSIETDNIAWECARHEGYHVAIDCVVLEILKDGCAVAPGESGEVVCTVLHNHTMPFVRYNLHDVASYAGRPCSCGSPFPLLQLLEGRADDSLVDANGNLRSARAVLDHFDEAWPVREFQVIQRDVDEVELVVVPAAAYDEAAAATLRAWIDRSFPGARTRLRLVEQIERGPGGKHKAFVSYVPSKP